MRILLVEDDPDLSRALQSGLERQGVVADVVGSLAEAALALREPVHQLLLLDRQLPDGDGAGFVATARALQPNLAVIMLTAKGRCRTRSKAWTSVPMTIWSSRWRSRN